MSVSIQTLIEALMLCVNIILVAVGMKVKADISEMKVFMFERFVTKTELENRLTDSKYDRRVKNLGQR